MIAIVGVVDTVAVHDRFHESVCERVMDNVVNVVKLVVAEKLRTVAEAEPSKVCDDEFVRAVTWCVELMDPSMVALNETVLTEGE